LIDTNVAIDFLLNRGGFFAGAEAVFALAEQNVIVGYVSASAVTDIFYSVRKELGKPSASEAIRHLLHVFHPATVTGDDIHQALDLEWSDFEDSVQFVVGVGLSVDCIVTRNVADFASGNIPALTPERFIETVTVA